MFTSIKTLKLLRRKNGRRFQLCLLVVSIISITCLSHRSASAFTITDADFVGGVYNLSYYSNSNTIKKNGSTIGTGITSLFLTNTAWSGPATEGGGQYLYASGGYYSPPSSMSASATMGWDFSAITGQISSVEITTHNYLFSFSYWASEAAGDQIYAAVATPVASFGTGTFTNLYTYTGPNLPDYHPDLPGAVGDAGRDITPNLSTSWLSNPSLLELEFGYNLQDLNIPAKHLQLFRSSTNPGFEMKVTLVEDDPLSGNVVPEPTTVALLGIGLVGLAGAEVRRRRKNKTVDNN